MPKPPLPPDVAARLRKPNPAVVASLRADGTPHTAATWYEWRDGRVLLSMDVSRKRLGYMRANPVISITVLDRDDIHYAVTLFGRVAEFVDDEGLSDIDALCRRYFGTDYPDRSSPRVTAWVEVERWHVWDSDRETSGIEDLERR